MKFMRKINKTRYLAVFASVTLIFLFGILMGQMINEYKMSEFSTQQRNLRTYLLSLTLQTELASKYICDIDVFGLTREKVKMGQELDFLENRLGKDNDGIIELKKEYSLLSIRQWLLVEKTKEVCDRDITTILYFYSNVENASICESQGYILDYLYRKYPESVAIYAFDRDIDTPALNTIKSIYDITEVPSLVINGKLYPGLQGKEKIESIIIGS